MEISWSIKFLALIILVVVAVITKSAFGSYIKADDMFVSSVILYASVIPLIAAYSVWISVDISNIFLKALVAAGVVVGVLVFIFAILILGALILPNSDAVTLKKATIISGILLVSPIVVSAWLIWRNIFS